MNRIKISLINNDQVVQAKTDLDDSQNNAFSLFIQKIRDELVTGETALLEIESQEKNSLKFEISQAV